MNIKKVTIEAVSIKTTKKDGTPYTYTSTKGDTKGKTFPRTMVSLKLSKDDSDWWMGWSYKANSPAESLKTGDVVELMLIEEPKDGGGMWKSWKFPKDEDRVAFENEQLKAKLAAFESAQKTPGVVQSLSPLSALQGMPSELGGSNLIAATPTGTALLAANPSASDEPPF